jgi:hypothetical protein
MTRGYAVEAYSHVKVASQLLEIVREMEDGEKKFSGLLDELHPNFKQSGRNLIHYLVLRSKEIREALRRHRLLNPDATLRSPRNYGWRMPCSCLDIFPFRTSPISW